MSDEKRRTENPWPRWSRAAAEQAAKARIISGFDTRMMSSIPPFDRRTLMTGTCALALASLAACAARAEDAPQTRRDAALAEPEPLTPSPQFEDAFANLVRSGTPVEEGVVLELPEEAENGNIVPYRIAVESPMTADDYIAEVHLLSTLNPQPKVAVFHFTPLSGVAAVAGRMRLAKTQEVIAVAVTSANTLRLARQIVHVGIGGCGEG